MKSHQKAKPKRYRFTSQDQAKSRATPNQNRQADRVSNGKVLLLGVKRNTTEYRRWRHLYEHWRARVPNTLESDTLCRQLATACVRREQLDSDVVNGVAVDPVALTRLCSLITRLTSKLESMVQAKAEADKPKSLLQMLAETAP